MTKEKLEIGSLRTTQDFNDMLDLAELDTQMEVLSHLNRNLFDYQMNFFKSQLMTWEELIEFIPEHDMLKYFTSRRKEYGTWDREKMCYDRPETILPYDFDWATCNYTGDPKNNPHRDTANYPANKDFFIVDTKNKKIHNFNKKFVNKFKFDYEEGYLLCRYFDSRQFISFESFTECYNHDREHSIMVKFDLKRNLFHSYSNEYNDKNRRRCGSWGDYGYWSKDLSRQYHFVSDEND